MKVEKLPYEVWYNIMKKLSNIGDVRNLSFAIKISVPYIEDFIIKAGKRRRANVRGFKYKLLSGSEIMKLQQRCERLRIANNWTRKKFYKGLTSREYALKLIQINKMLA